jgi:hypothetical protein
MPVVFAALVDTVSRWRDRRPACGALVAAGTRPAAQTAGRVVADRRAPVFVTPSELDRQLDGLRAFGYRTVVDDGRLVLLRCPGR